MSLLSDLVQIGVYIGVGDGGRGQLPLPLPPNSSKTIFFGQKSCKIRAFC